VFNKDTTIIFRDLNGKVIQKLLKFKDYERIEEKNWYDKKGNLLKKYLAIDDGATYEFKYDQYNRLMYEKRPGTYLFLFSPVVFYQYEYY
jgi:hypothetical protein